MDMSTQTETLKLLLDRQRQAWMRAEPDRAERLGRLRRLEQALDDHQDALLQAVSRDFGHRSAFETLLAEFMTARGELRHIRRHLRYWMRRRPQPVNWRFWPARAWLEYRPLGVVGVMAPWNYPINLVVAPLAAALAAGNHVLLKPSEQTPHTADALKAMIDEAFPTEQVAVVTGGVEVSKAFSALPLDHLLFTGSTEVGRHVMRAAADHLTPVTLELGGKSPVVLSADAGMERAAAAIASGKFFNAGQTCIAPDYALVPPGRSEALAAGISRWVESHLPEAASNDDYTAIINADHAARLTALIDDAESRGAKVIRLGGAGTEGMRRMPPTILQGVTDEMRIMQEEIFGPVLPIVEVADLDSAIAYIRARPRPLALYHFGGDEDQQRIVSSTLAGGICLNDTLMHYAEPGLPFGGVGDSGMGQYHGFEGFRTFSKLLPVFRQSRLSAGSLIRPPYSGWKATFIRWLSR